MKFEEWFKKQFGELSTKPTWELRQDYEDAERVYLALKEVHDKQIEMEDRYKAAGHAWNVKDEDKDEPL